RSAGWPIAARSRSAGRRICCRSGRSMGSRSCAPCGGRGSGWIDRVRGASRTGNRPKKMGPAHLGWKKKWGSTAGGAGWLIPEPDVVKVAERLRIAGEHQRALDLGCGVGRHALGLARLGYDTAAVDMADAGLAEVSRNARAENLSVAVQAAPMTALPFG